MREIRRLGRTPSEQRLNVEDLAEDIPRGPKGRDSIGRDELIAETLMKLGYDRSYKTPRMVYKPTGKVDVPPPIDGRILRDFARHAYRVYHQTKR